MCNSCCMSFALCRQCSTDSYVLSLPGILVQICYPVYMVIHELKYWIWLWTYKVNTWLSHVRVWFYYWHPKQTHLVIIFHQSETFCLREFVEALFSATSIFYFAEEEQSLFIHLTRNGTAEFQKNNFTPFQVPLEWMYKHLQILEFRKKSQAH